MVFVIADRRSKTPAAVGRSPRIAIILGAILGVVLSVLANPPDPAQTTVALAAASGLLAVLRLGGRAGRRDWYPVQLMLSLNLGVFVLTQHALLGVPVSVMVGASAVALATVAACQRFRK